MFGDGKKCKVKKCKTTGKPCKNDAVTGYDVCRMHGGKTPRGVESANYKHGGYTPYVPYSFNKIYEEMRDDETLSNVREELALGKMFIAGHLQHLGTVDNEETLPKLLGLLQDIKVYYRTVNSVGMANTIDAMERIIQDRLEQLKTENKIMERVEQQRKLVETEQKISLQGERAISVELFGMLLGAIFKAIEMGVKDKDERITVSATIRQLIESAH
jgi:hypothetical protein